jgi:GNAT superfamily N-acetyltransferase
VRVRRAELGDVPAIAALLAELGYPVADDALAARLGRLPDTTSVLVAEEDEEVVGMAALDVRQGLEHEEPRGRIVAFIVRPDARGRGVARALMQAIEAAARAAGAVHLHVTSAHHRADAHAAYVALGFRETGLRFGKQI